MRILVKYPTRGRPRQALDVLRGWVEQRSGTHPVEFLVTLDSDDPTMNDVSVLGQLRSMPGVTIVCGRHRSKVDAFNAALQSRPFDIVVAASDDMIAVERGYDHVIASDMLAAFPDLDGALHYYDGYTGHEGLITLSIMGRALFDRFGYIYHPSYRSYYCDNEFTSVVKALGRVRYTSRQLFHHDHNGRRPDPTSMQNDKDIEADRLTYVRRQSQHFGLSAGADAPLEGCRLDPYGTHLPMLMKALVLTRTGPVLELGCGHYSTPILHDACVDRPLLSLDSNIEFVDKFAPLCDDRHQVRWVQSWDAIALAERDWEVVLVDHYPGERRGLDISRLADHARFIVVHDSEDRISYGYDAVLPRFRFRYDYKRLHPWTTVVSNIDDAFVR
ncbi:MAG: hypothetical protein ACRD2A_03215 [Vicinamibacterales bacterium]